MRKFIPLTSITVVGLFSFSGCIQSTDTAIDTTPPAVTTEAQTVSFANTKCPIMGGKPKAELTAQYEGNTIGFCCEGCHEKWAALSADEKAEKFAKVGGETEPHEDHAEHDGDHAEHGDQS